MRPASPEAVKLHKRLDRSPVGRRAQQRLWASSPGRLFGDQRSPGHAPAPARPHAPLRGLSCKSHAGGSWGPPAPGQCGNLIKINGGEKGRPALRTPPVVGISARSLRAGGHSPPPAPPLCRGATPRPAEPPPESRDAGDRPSGRAGLGLPRTHRGSPLDRTDPHPSLVERGTRHLSVLTHPHGVVMPTPPFVDEVKGFSQGAPGLRVAPRPSPQRPWTTPEGGGRGATLRTPASHQCHLTTCPRELSATLRAPEDDVLQPGDRPYAPAPSRCTEGLWLGLC